MSLRRRIFMTLRGVRGPIPVVDIARSLGAHIPTIANECCRMEQVGVLDRPNGPRKGYRLIVSMLPEDAATIAQLVDVYGKDALGKAARS
jgi:DNA-binding MarR family transcriptional regulator